MKTLNLYMLNFIEYRGWFGSVWFGSVGFGCILWHINFSGLFDAKSCIYK